MPTRRYFTALVLDQPAAWSMPVDFHPHITMHYFGAITSTNAHSIKKIIEPFRDEVFELRPRAIETFGKGLALVFEDDDELARLLVSRVRVSKLDGLQAHVDQTFPEFRPHMSLPTGIGLTPNLMKPLHFVGPLMLASVTDTVVV
jgi:hypothetical protein